MAFAFFRLFTGDLIKDTLHLGNAEMGSYFLLILAYYAKGQPLKDNDAHLANIARCTPENWTQIRPILADFFQIQDGYWHHKRIDRELADAKRRYLAHLQAARQTNAKRYGERDAKRHAYRDAKRHGKRHASTSLTDSKSESESESESERVHEPLKRVHDERSRSLGGTGGEKPIRSSLIRAKSEAELMQKLAETLGPDEMKRAGGHWRTDWIRKAPQLLDRALLELAAQVKAGKPIANRGAYLEDLLKRWQ